MLKNVIREARNELGLNQEDVSEAVGVTKQTYLKWENGTTEPKASQIVKLASTLKITAEEICTGKRFKQCNLQEFISKLNYYRPSREVEVLETWDHITDYESYFESLNEYNQTEYERAKYEAESSLEAEIQRQKDEREAIEEDAQRQQDAM